MRPPAPAPLDRRPATTPAPSSTAGVSFGSADPCLEVNWIYRGALVGLLRWMCHKRDAGKHAEASQPTAALAWVARKGFDIRCSRGRAFIDSNSLLLHNGGEPYETSHPVGSGDSGGAITLSAGLLPELVGAAAGEPGVFTRLSLPCATPFFLLSSRLTHQPPSASHELAIEEAVLSFAVAALRAGERLQPSPRPRHSPVADRVRILLQCRLDRPWNLTQLASYLGTTPFRLWRAFHAETGLSLHHYQTRLRLRAALERLAEGETDLSGLAFDLGFSSHSHFGAAFRREFGLPPSQARKLIRLRSTGLAELLASARLTSPADLTQRPAER